MKDSFRDIAEEKIRESIAKGESKNLPGAGKPIKIENLYFLPPEFIFAYTVLKNSGYLNLVDDEKAPVSLSRDDINLLNANDCNPTDSVQENSLVPFVSDEIISLNESPSIPSHPNTFKKRLLIIV